MVKNSLPLEATPIRVAILGYGLSGRVFHSFFIEADTSFELVAIVTGDDARRTQAAAEHGNARIYRSFEDLESAGESIDLIVVAGPPDSHLELALKSLAIGAAVVVDKPFLSSTEGAQLLIDAAEAAGRPLMVFQNRRWDGDFLTVRSLIRSGRLGDVFHFESNFEHWAPQTSSGWKDHLPASSAGGVAWDLGSHLVDQALVLFGPATTVTSQLRTVRAGGGNDDHAEIHLIHNSGVVSRLLMSRLSHGQGPRFRVLGTKGSFISFGLDPQENALEKGALPTEEGFGDVAAENFGTLTEHTPEGTIETRITTETGDYAAFYRGAAAAIRGTGPEPVPSAEAREVVAVLELATRTATSAPSE